MDKIEINCGLSPNNAVTELVGWEHSMKNELIIAKYTGQPRKNARERMDAILSEFNLQDLLQRFN